MGVEKLHEKLAKWFDIERGDSKALCVSWNGVKSKGNLRNDSESAEGPRHEFVEVVARNIFDDLATRASNGAIGQDYGHANDEIAKTAIP
jgi:hypothetical protein